MFDSGSASRQVHLGSLAYQGHLTVALTTFGLSCPHSPSEKFKPWLLLDKNVILYMLLWLVRDTTVSLDCLNIVDP